MTAMETDKRYLLRALGVGEGILASMLEVTVERLARWPSSPSPKLDGQVPALATLVRALQAGGVDGRLLLNALGEPAYGKEGDASLLYYAVNEPSNPNLVAMAVKVAEGFK